MRCTVMLTLGLLTTAGTVPALSQTSFLPLAPGCAWTYTDGAGHERSCEAIGFAQIHGENVVELAWEEPDQVYHNFWSHGPDGSVHLHAAWNEDGFVVSYSPPVLMLPAVEAAGRCWSSSARIYWSLDTSVTDGDILTFTVCATAGGMLTVPAGDFHVVGFSDATQPGTDFAAVAHDALGRRLVGSARQSGVRAYAVGVGLVKEDDWELAAYGGPTPNGTANWSAIKALYR